MTLKHLFKSFKKEKPKNKFVIIINNKKYIVSNLRLINNSAMEGKKLTIIQGNLGKE